MDALGALEALSALLLATSLAAERLVAIAKTLVPWLALETTTPGLEVKLSEDRRRRIVLGAAAFVASYVTVALVFGSPNPGLKVSLGGVSYHLAVLALLGSGGSSLWGSIVGYVREVKDIKTAQKAAARLELKTLAARTQNVVTGIGEAM